MKIKLDENLPRQIAPRLQALGHDVHTVHEERLVGGADSEIWHRTQTESRFVITQDLDFSDARKYAPGAHHGILLIRLSTPNRRTLTARVVQLFECEDVEQWVGCFVVATEHKLRIRRPGAHKNS